MSSLLNKNTLVLSGLGLLSAALILSFGLVAADPSVAANTQPFFAHLATQLGVSQASAGLAIDIISGGAGIWSVVAAVAGLSGAGLIAVGGLAAIKQVIKNEGKDFATSW